MQDSSFDQLTSRRLVIRRFVPSDAEDLSSYKSDPEVARYQAWDCPYPIGEASRFIAGVQHLAPGTPGVWFQFAVSLATSGTVVGDIGLCADGADDRQAELGFTFAKAHQHQGLATEAVRAVIQYAFQHLAMHRIFSRTDERNLPAQRLLERIGFRRETELQERVLFKGAWATELLYAQLQSEWRPEHSG